MSASALIRALLILIVGSLFIYWGIFNTPTQLLRETAFPISEVRSRFTYLGAGISFLLLGLWIIRRQLCFVPSLSRFGTSGNGLLWLAAVVGMSTVGYATWDNARIHYVRPASPATAADAGPAPAPAPLQPAGSLGDEPTSAPSPLPAAVPQAGEPASAPAPLPPKGE